MLVQKKTATRRALASSLMLTISIVSLIVSTRSLVGIPERVGLSILSFFQRGFNSVGDFFSETISSISELKKLEDSYEQLLARVEMLGNLERNYTDLKRENDRLKEQLKYATTSDYSSISSRIISRDPENLYSTLILDKGALQGVSKNQAVIAYQDGIEGLVGRVIEVGRTSCVVSPIYDSSAYVAVRLERSRYEGLAVGSGSTDSPVVIRYIKKRAKEEIQYGDMVVTSGLQSLYPPGISIGRITKLRDLDYLTSLELEMEPVIDFGRLEYVFIVHIISPSIEGTK